MPRPLLPGLPGRLAEVSRWRRFTAALGAIGAVALAVGIILGTGLAGSSKGASPAAKTSGSATVQRRDLVATDTESGTLSYAVPQTVFNRLTGTVTWLPTVGQVIRRGQTLYKVDGAPVVLFDGTVPAYRSLSEGVADGPDVQELKQNLVALGFDPSHQITINQTFDAATAAAVDNWQSALGETQTGSVTLGQIVFLPGPQRITSVDTVLGSTGGASGAANSSGASGSGSSASAGSSGSGTATGASTTVAAPRAQFVSLTTTPAPAATAPATTTPCPSSGSPTDTTATTTTPANPPPKCDQHDGGGAGNSKSGASKSPSTLAALLALLKAETLELKKSGSSSAGAGAGAGAGGRAGGASSSGTVAGRSGGGGGSSGGGGGGAGATSSAGGSSGASATGSGSSGAAAAQAILETTSTQLVVTVDLDATKQTEAVVGEPVTVELPDGSTADGKITAVSPVAQTSSSSSSSSSAAGGGGSSTPSATVPVTITLTGHRHVKGLDQAAVSVNFEQQKASNVLSVPVTALVATAGGGYAVQEAAAPQRLIGVTPGLFAAGYVQISGSGVFPGLQVTDSQG